MSDDLFTQSLNRRIEWYQTSDTGNPRDMDNTIVGALINIRDAYLESRPPLQPAKETRSYIKQDELQTYGNFVRGEAHPVHKEFAFWGLANGKQRWVPAARLPELRAKERERQPADSRNGTYRLSKAKHRVPQKELYLENVKLRRRDRHPERPEFMYWSTSGSTGQKWIHEEDEEYYTDLERQHQLDYQHALSSR